MREQSQESVPEEQSKRAIQESNLRRASKESNPRENPERTIQESNPRRATPGEQSQKSNPRRAIRESNLRRAIPEKQSEKKHHFGLKNNQKVEVFETKVSIREKIFPKRFIDIDRNDGAVAAARVLGGPSRRGKKELHFGG